MRNLREGFKVDRADVYRVCSQQVLVLNGTPQGVPPSQMLSLVVFQHLYEPDTDKCFFLDL